MYSYSNLGPAPEIASLAAALATQAIGSVRLQVTGKPPTRSVLCRESALQDSRLAGKAVAMTPCRTCLRSRKCAVDVFSEVLAITLETSSNVKNWRRGAAIAREVYTSICIFRARFTLTP